MYSVLVADDKKVFFHMVERLPYFREGHKFYIAGYARNGLEALELLREKPVDVVLTDIRMPLIDGIGLLKTIKEEKLCSCTIFLSEYSDFEYAKQGIINGAFDYILKPVDNDAMAATFDRAYLFLKQKEAEAPAKQNGPKQLAERLMKIMEEGNKKALATLMRELPEGDKPEDALRFQQSAHLILQEEFQNRYPWLPCFCQPKEDGLSQEQILHCMDLLALFRFPGKNKAVRDIWNYVLDCLEKPCDLDSCAEHFHMNGKYISAIFKQDTGINFRSFLTTCRMERAKMLLVCSDLMVGDIADRLCYSDAEYFSRVFRKYEGCTPKAFREAAGRRREGEA